MKRKDKTNAVIIVYCICGKEKGNEDSSRRNYFFKKNLRENHSKAQAPGKV